MASRKAEFTSTINSKRERPQWVQQRQAANGIEPRKFNRLALDQRYREFMRASELCSHKIRSSSEKLDRFTVLAKKRAVFDDGELNRLIAEIRSDIGESKNQLDNLQNHYELKHKHMESIVDTLHRRLANVTTSFKATLEMRSRSVQQQTARHEMFAGPSNSNHTSLAQVGTSNYASNGPVYIGAPNDYRQQYQQQTQQFLMNDQSDLAERVDKMQLIESTIVELSTVFNQLAHMVQSQGETITRIDMNISETAGNVESAHDALLRYFASINSNRWLILKVFGVLFFFFVIFVMFAT